MSADASTPTESGSSEVSGAGTRPGTLEQRRVWDLPVRILHWVLVASILVLTVTGLYIAIPALSIRGDPGFFMGWVRLVHILTGFVFIAAVLGRIIWAFQGNHWARWNQFVPVSRDRRRDAKHALAFYTFLRRDPPRNPGHNALAGLAYLVLFVLLVTQAFTGLALTALPWGEGAVWAASGWVFGVAEIPTVRLVHHLIMWLLLGFMVHHVYSAGLIDAVERSGVISSMVSGFKTLRRRNGDD